LQRLKVPPAINQFRQTIDKNQSKLTNALTLVQPPSSSSS
jgi:hypothetical protein